MPHRDSIGWLVLIVAGLICPLSSGCLSPGSSQLIGTWELQRPDDVGGPSGGPTSTMESGSAEAVVENTDALFAGVADGESAGTMKLVFHRSGSLETITDFPAAQSHKYWRWSMESWDPDGQVAVVHCQMSHETAKTVITFIDQNTIQLVPPNIDVLQTELRFVRQ